MEENRKIVDLEVFDFSSEPINISDPIELDSKMIAYLEREVRQSFEYRKYINYLKTELDLTKCSLIPQLDISDMNFNLEFHHYPLNLYQITDAVGKSLLADLKDGEGISPFRISEKIVEEHYNNNIGLVPLSETLHEMAHSGSIVIPIDKVNGNYKNFLAKYSKFLDQEIKDKIDILEVESTSEETKKRSKEKLKKDILDFNIKYNKEEDNDESQNEQ